MKKSYRRRRRRREAVKVKGLRLRALVCPFGANSATLSKSRTSCICYIRCSPSCHAGEENVPCNFLFLVKLCVVTVVVFFSFNFYFIFNQVLVIRKNGDFL